MFTKIQKRMMRVVIVKDAWLLTVGMGKCTVHCTDGDLSKNGNDI